MAYRRAHAEFETFIPMGTKEMKAARGEVVDVIFKISALVSAQTVMHGHTISTETLADKHERDG